MYIITIVPLLNIPRQHPQTYTYFSNVEISKGGIVLVPSKKKEITAIVISCKKVVRKIELKKANFSLKPIKKIINPLPLITNPQIELLNWMNEYFFSSLSGLFNFGLPSEKILEKIDFDKNELPIKKNSKNRKNNSYYLLGDNFNFLKKEIKKNISQNKQVLFVFPNQVKREIYEKELSNFNPLILGKKNSQKQKREDYKNILAGKEKIIFGLRNSIFLPFFDLGMIVVVDETSTLLETRETKIHFIVKFASLKMKEIYNSDFIFCNSNLGAESRQMIDDGLFKLIDSKDNKQLNLGEIKKYKSNQKDILIPKIISKIKESLKNNEKIFIFANRKGWASALICNNCNHIFKCPTCDASMSYYSDNQSYPQKRFLSCRHCYRKLVAPSTCPQCGGHLIKFYGFAVDKVLSKIKSLFPNARIEKFDSDNLKSISSEKKIIEKLLNNQVDIIIGTELFLKYSIPMDLSIISSWEQIINFPDFRARERAIKYLKDISNFSKDIIIQSFSEPILDESLSKEISLRKKLLYPPFSDIIKISFSDKDKNKAIRIANFNFANLKNLLDKEFGGGNFQITPPLPGFISKIRNKYIFDIFLKIKKDSSDVLSENIIKKRNIVLNSLSKEATIKINPLNIL